MRRTKGRKEKKRKRKNMVLYKQYGFSGLIWQIWGLATWICIQMLLAQRYLSLEKLFISVCSSVSQYEKQVNYLLFEISVKIVWIISIQAPQHRVWQILSVNTVKSVRYSMHCMIGNFRSLWLTFWCYLEKYINCLNLCQCKSVLILLLH